MAKTEFSGFLSSRAAEAQRPALPYWPAFFKAQSDLWSSDNLDGYIALTVAENRLTTELVQQGMMQHSSFPPNMLYYNDMRGIPELRQSIANLLQDTIMQGLQVLPDCLSVSAGVGAVLDLLFHCIAEPGAGVLIPAPYYPAFDNDLRVRNSVTTLPVHLDPQLQDYTAALDAAAAAGQRAGHPAAAVMFTNPSNPQGTLFTRQQLVSIIRWCLDNKVHCISDEVYALSIFDDAAEFVSAEHVVQQEVAQMEAGHLADDLVHTVWGFSKDFCASGMRVGCLYSKNKELHSCFDNIAYFASPAFPLQWSLSQLLNDTAWLTQFLEENKRRLRAAYNSLTGALDNAGIPYTPAAGAMFLWVDLRSAFGKQQASWRDEDQLWRHMVDKHKIILSPGSSCHAAEPGFFRVCYAWPPAACLTAAASRISAAMKEFQALSTAPVPALVN